MTTDMQTLKSMDLFSELTDDELEGLSVIIHPMRITEGEVLTRRGEFAANFYVVVSGNYMIYFKEGKAFTLHDRGNIIGWSTIVTPFEYTGTCVALTEGEVLCLAGEKFLELLQSNAVVADKIMKKINPIIEKRLPFFRPLTQDDEH